MKLRIRGAYNTVSGYSDLTRYVITALHLKNYEFDIVPCTWTAETTIISEFEEIKKLRENDNSPYDIEIVLTPPDSYGYFNKTTNLKDSKYKICYTMWEADQIHPDWTNILNNQANEVWLPCKHNVEAFKNSGVKIPVTKMPFPIPEKRFTEIVDVLPKELDDYYKFYSIFQWTPRKNPLGLLQAYFTEFNKDDKVILVLRTYLGSHVSSEIKTIIGYINEIKRKMNLPYYPPIYFIHDFLDENELLNLHHECDCYILPHKGEGWSLPVTDAMMSKNIVITTDYSGTSEYCNDGNSILLDELYTEPVYDMVHCYPKYNSYMTWKAPTIQCIKYHMRYVYMNSNNDIMLRRKEKAYNDIITNYNYDIISNKIIERLKAIYGTGN